MDAYDADVLISSCLPGHAQGTLVARHLERAARTVGAGEPVGIGSVLLLPELLARPSRDQRDDEVEALMARLARLDLRPVDLPTGTLATALAARYRLKPTDAVHLATAVEAGADRFITNNRKDFARVPIDEIEVAHPEDLR